MDAAYIILMVERIIDTSCQGHDNVCAQTGESFSLHTGYSGREDCTAVESCHFNTLR